MTATMIGFARQIGGTISEIFLLAADMPIVLKIAHGSLGSVCICRKICTCKRRGKSGYYQRKYISHRPTFSGTYGVLESVC